MKTCVGEDNLGLWYIRESDKEITADFKSK